MACECISEMNKVGAEHNTKLSDTLIFGREGQSSALVVTLVTEKVNPRNRRKVSILPTFCPFCGTRYREETLATGGAS